MCEREREKERVSEREREIGVFVSSFFAIFQVPDYLFIFRFRSSSIKTRFIETKTKSEV